MKLKTTGLILSLFLFHMTCFAGQNECIDLVNRGSARESLKPSDSKVHVDDPSVFFKIIVSIPMRAAFIRAYEKVTNEWIEPPFTGDYSFEVGQAENLSPAHRNDRFSLSDHRLRRYAGVNYGINESYIEPQKLGDRLAALNPSQIQKISEYALTLLEQYFTIFENSDAKIKYDQELKLHGITEKEEREILQLLSQFNGRHGELSKAIATLLKQKRLFGNEYVLSVGQLRPPSSSKDLAVTGLVGVLLVPSTFLMAHAGSFILSQADPGALSYVAATAVSASIGLLNYIGFRNITLDSQAEVNRAIDSNISLVRGSVDSIEYTEVPVVKKLPTFMPSLRSLMPWGRNSVEDHSGEKPALLGTESETSKQRSESTFDEKKYLRLLEHFDQQLNKSQSYLKLDNTNKISPQRLRDLLDQWNSIKRSILEVVTLQNSLIDEISSCKQKCGTSHVLSDEDLALLQQRVDESSHVVKKVQNFLEKQLVVLEGLRQEIEHITGSNDYRSNVFSSALKEMAATELYLLNLQVRHLNAQLDGEFLFQLVQDVKFYLEKAKRESL